ncbi:hypothetical protein AGMMS49574_25070 [Bacteroidia bacterium]|nr:hypothetical protein AGMMS49574_25070 [Bacteroidia bacterium]
MNNSNSTQDKISNMEITRNVNEQHYHTFGFQRAGEAKGMPDAFNKTLDIVYQQARNEILQSPIQGLRKEEALDKLKDSNIKLGQIQQEIDEKNQKLKVEQDKKDKLEKELGILKTNPDELLGNDIKGNAIHKIYYWIFLVVTIFLSIYIFFFYNSAGYSAIFKEFTADNTKIVQAIFDSQALSQMFSEGIGGVMFLLVFPFLFIAAGIVIHLLPSKKHWIFRTLTFVVILISFIWDVILAYNITKKIDDIRIGGLVGDERADSVRMTLKTAIQDVNFWTIIFAGFVAYMILSIVFYFCMDFKHKLNIVHNAKEVKQKEIENCEKTCKEIQTKIQELQQNKISASEEIEYYKNLISGLVVKITDMLPALNGFYTGWIAYINSSNLPENQIEECKQCHNAFLQQLWANAGITNINN